MLRCSGTRRGVSPRSENDDDRSKERPSFGEDVLVARWVRLVLAPFENPAGDETLEPAGEQTRRDSQVVLELVEPGVAVEGIVEDQQGPPLAHEAERRRQRAFPVFESDLFGHAFCFPPSNC